jgi:succinate dehydrogenase/fumarate reductase flavoprotein subunit
MTAACDPLEPLQADRVADWWREADVIVVGQGAAGGPAAIEAARAGARTLVLERMSRGGGAAALSTGLTYFGGGTSVQKACGFDDDPARMAAYVALAGGRAADPERIRLYCEGSVDHFEWFRSLGVEFKESYYADKVTHPLTDDCLLFTGNEDVHPFCLATPPVPRGHKPAREGEAGGYLMEAVLAASAASGAVVLNDSRALRLVHAADGRVVGVVARIEGNEVHLAAKRGVILAAGGFIMNPAMLKEYAPKLVHVNHPTGTEGDDGAGIRMGQGVGADLVNMDEGLLLNAYYPPSAHLKGVLVDAGGRRFVNEDSAIGRTSDAIVCRAGGRAWLIVDDSLYGRTQAGHKIAAVGESFEELEHELGLPRGALVTTLARYNRHAARGEDPEFHKGRAWLCALEQPPFAALDCSSDRSIFGGFTLGGLRVRAFGEVERSDGSAIPGLYAAGRCSAGLCREGASYASGLSIGDASFFGRLAGRQAAAAEPWA